MQLKSLTFSELQGQDAEWFLDDLTLAQINLLVGKNATGKSRILNVIYFLSRLLTGEQKEIFSKGSIECVFERDADTWKYSIAWDTFAVVCEDLFYNSKQVLHRGDGGIGRILAEDIEGKAVQIKFSVPGSQVAVFAKRDDVQHPFLKPLHDWANSVRLFRFGTEMTPYNLALAIKIQGIRIEVNEKETNNLVPIFDKAAKELGEPYREAIISDMKVLGYDLEKIEIRRPTNLATNLILPGELHGVSVRERDLRCNIDQPSMSQGMFRALSLLAQVNYYAMAKKDACFLVDDIGDGLDFERSCELIDLLRDKAERSNFQLLMSSNNRFVMNRVPLEEWCVLQRNGHHVSARNYRNSKDVFERFKITGLSNFDLLTTDFLEKVLPHA
jgi:energy-coupling factor transporter ATP-binding protein EcfA2